MLLENIYIALGLYSLQHATGCMQLLSAESQEWEEKQNCAKQDNNSINKYS